MVKAADNVAGIISNEGGVVELERLLHDLDLARRNENRYISKCNIDLDKGYSVSEVPIVGYAILFKPSRAHRRIVITNIKVSRAGPVGLRLLQSLTDHKR